MSRLTALRLGGEARRAAILVESQSHKKTSPVRGGIFRPSFLAGFENISRVVFHAELLQQRNVFLAE